MKILSSLLGLSVCLAAAAAQDGSSPSPSSAHKRPPRPGVATPGVKRDIATLMPSAIFPVDGTPDWLVVTGSAVWVANGPKDTVHRLDPKTNQVAAVVTVGRRPCSGLAAGFGSVWVPSCGDKTVSRIDETTNQIVATIPVGPAASEGGIAASPEGVWLVTDPKGVLSRIDPSSNRVTAEVPVPPNSAGCVYGEGSIWITTPDKNLLTRVDPKTNQVTQTIDVGLGPRFVTVGGGSVWTLNQGDGTVSRVDAHTGKLLTQIEVGIPGTGGEIAYGEGHVWATVFEIPISEIDPATNQVVKQWTGPGGDSIRVGHGWVWLSNLRNHNVWKVQPR